MPPEGAESVTYLGREGEQEQRVKVLQVPVEELDKLNCYHQEQCKAALRKSSSRAQVRPHSSSFLSQKNGEREKANTSYKENIM